MITDNFHWSNNKLNLISQQLAAVVADISKKKHYGDLISSNEYTGKDLSY
jgi:hypothetical protein